MKKNKLLQKVILIISALLMLAGINIAMAATNKPEVDTLLNKFTMSTQTETPTTTDYIASLPETASTSTFIGKVVYFMLIIANIMAFISFVGSGLFMVMSMGDTEMLKKAKQIFTYTILAMLICATALAVVTGLTKIEFFNP